MTFKIIIRKVWQHGPPKELAVKNPSGQIGSKHTIMEQMISQNILNNLVRSMTKRGTRRLKRPGASLAARSTGDAWLVKSKASNSVSVRWINICNLLSWLLQAGIQTLHSMISENTKIDCYACWATFGKVYWRRDVCPLDWATELTSGPII